MDVKLPWHQRLAMRFHLLYCVWCRRYSTQLHFLRKATGTIAHTADTEDSAKLSDEAKDRIRETIRQAVMKDEPPR